MPANENGRPTAEAIGTPVDQQGASPASPSMKDNYPRPMGATPFTPYTPFSDAQLAALREAERYVVAEIIGDC